MSVSNVKSLLLQYKTTQGDFPKFREIRSQLIQLVGSIYNQKKLTDCGLDGKYYQKGLSDGFLNRAEAIIDRNDFSDSPGVLGRLKPLAEKYVSEWSEVLTALNQYEVQEPQLNARVDAFVQAHLNFANQFTEELKVRARDTHLGAQLNYPETLKSFYCTIVEFLTEQPVLGAQLKTHLENSSEDVFLIVPHLCILQLIEQKDSTCPELLKKFEMELAELRLKFVLLEAEEQESLKAVLFEDKPLDSSANALHLEIQKIAYQLHSKDSAQPFARCFRTLITELNADLTLAEVLKKDLQQITDVQPDISGALYALLHLPFQTIQPLVCYLPSLKSLEEFQGQFAQASPVFKEEVREFLYQAKAIGSKTSFMKIADVERDLSNEPKLYRLFGILQIAISQ